MKQPIEYSELKQLILNCPDKQVQAIMAFQYVLACRIGELFPYRHKPYHFNPKDNIPDPETAKRKPFNQRERIPEKEYETFGLTKSSFTEYPDHWEVWIPSFKKGKGKPMFKVGIILKGNEYEKWLEEICIGWKNSCPTESLFSIKHDTARKRLKKQLEFKYDTKAHKTFSSHNLRDSRSDHLLKIFGYSVVDVQKTLDHQNLQTTSFYLDSDVSERLQKLKNPKG